MKTRKLTKQVLELACRNAGMKPVKRDNINGTSVYVADGFSSPPHYKFRRFGVEPHEFPWGAFVTLWWLERGEGELDVGRPMIFDAFHDPEYSKDTKQLMRINSALQDAKEHMQRRTKVRLNG